MDTVKKFYKGNSFRPNLFLYLKNLHKASNFSFKLLPDFLELSFILDEECDGPKKHSIFNILFTDFIFESLVDKINCFTNTESYVSLYNALIITKSLGKYSTSDLIQEIGYITNSERLKLLNAVLDNFNSKEECENFVKVLDNLGLLAAPSGEW